MKICMMTNTYLPHVGGVARSVHTFSEMFRQRGHDVLVVAPTFEADDQVPEEIEQTVVRLPAIQQFNGSDFSVRLPMTWLMEQRLKDFQPDIVHSHHPYLLGDSALRYAADKNAPVIFTHHTLHEEYTHYVPFDSPALRKFVIELCTHYANLCDAVIAPSESVAELIKSRGVVTPIEVIPTGVEVGAFARGRGQTFRKRHEIPRDAFVIGHLGRLAPEKNLAYLSRAVVRFLRENSDARFLLVGEGPSATELVELAKRAGVHDQMVLTGKLTGRDVCDAYRAMDVFAFSSFSETQGMVLAEAMAAGLPAVALDASGVREVLRDGENGFLLPADADEEQFASCMQKLRDSNTLFARFKDGAQRTARRFSRDASVRRALALYQNVLKKTRRERAVTEHEALGHLFKRIEIEWALIAQKANAAVDAMTVDRHTEKIGS